MSCKCPDQETLDKIFPPERTDAFFDALYGGAEEGAYDIRLVCHSVDDKKARMAFQLIRREGKCLKCSLTYGLPAVFQRHPLLDLKGVALAAFNLLGWTGDVKWTVGQTLEISDDLHELPFVLEKE